MGGHSLPERTQVSDSINRLSTAGDSYQNGPSNQPARLSFSLTVQDTLHSQYEVVTATASAAAF